MPFHPAFKAAVLKLYGWSSDENGICDAIKDADKVERARRSIHAGDLLSLSELPAYR